MTIAAPSISAEFSDKVNPFLVKELRQGLRTRLFEGAFLGAHLIIVFIVGMEALVVGFSGSEVTQGQQFQWMAEVFFLCFALPMRAFASVRDEMNADSLDLLRVANVDAARVINGKWPSQMLLVTILLVSFMPYHLLRFYIGHIEPLVEIMGLAATWAAAALSTAFFMFFATLGIGGRIAWMMFGMPFALWALVVMMASILSPYRGSSSPVVSFFIVGGVFWFGGLMFFLTLGISGFEERARNRRTRD